MGAPDIRVFAGPIPDDINKFGWEQITRNRIVPPLKELARYAATKGVKLSLQNHGDMASTADQAIQIIKWVNDPNIGIKNDTGSFRNFGSTSGLNYDWYADINAALPYTINFQVKKKPAGEETDIPMDLDRLFTGVRSSDYRGYLPVEMLWAAGEPGNPENMSTPPYDEIKSFLAQIRASLEQTKKSGTLKPSQ